eukprot:scaffold34922_cov141-Amphora_coffeaeformis.AAC.8
MGLHIYCCTLAPPLPTSGSATDTEDVSTVEVRIRDRLESYGTGGGQSNKDDLSLSKKQYPCSEQCHRPTIMFRYGKLGFLPFLKCAMQICSRVRMVCFYVLTKYGKREDTAWHHSLPVNVEEQREEESENPMRAHLKRNLGFDRTTTDCSVEDLGSETIVPAASARRKR